MLTITELDKPLARILQSSRVKTFAIACVVLASISPVTAGAAVLLNVTGAQDTGQTVDADEAVAAQFTLTQPFSNVSITAPTAVPEPPTLVLVLSDSVFSR
jgi:hypothetical protein